MADETNKDMSKKTIVGLTEKITIKGQGQDKELIARIDTGATKSSIDLALAYELKLGPVVDSRLIKSAHGTKLRPVVEAEVRIKGRNLRARFTIADRAHMKYDVLIGQNLLKMGFLVDPSQRADSPTYARPKK